jgi:hemolysin activation/secretion protein
LSFDRFLGISMPHLRTVIAVLALSSGYVQADTTPVWPAGLPDAGVLMRQTEQTLRQNQMQRSSQKHDAFAPAMTLTEATTVTPQTIKFLGVKLISVTQLQAISEPYLNRPLNQHDLQRLMEAATAAYRKEGWVVRVYIPSQDLSQSELNVQILENMPSSAR